MKCDISKTALVVLLFFSAGLLTLTRPSGMELSLAAEIISTAAAVVIEGIILLPAVIYVKKYRLSPLSGLYGSSYLLGAASALLYALFFIFTAANSLCSFGYFLKVSFSEAINGGTVVVLMCAVCLYAACQGLGTLSRTAFIIGVIFLILTLTVMFAVVGRFKSENLTLFYPPLNGAKPLILATTLKLSRSAEIVTLPFLASCCDKPLKPYGAFLLFKFIFTVAVVIIVRAVLGAYAGEIFDPFYSLSTYARVSVVERFDSLYGFVWTLCAFVKISANIFLAAICLKSVFPVLKVKPPAFFAAAVVFVISFYVVVFNKWSSDVVRSPHYLFIIILGGVLPLTGLILNALQEKKERIL